jgi:hypothetical protein
MRLPGLEGNSARNFIAIWKEIILQLLKSLRDLLRVWTGFEFEHNAIYSCISLHSIQAPLDCHLNLKAGSPVCQNESEKSVCPHNLFQNELDIFNNSCRELGLLGGWANVPKARKL